MKMSLVALALTLILQSQLSFASELDWLVGCWESADARSKEAWVKEPDGSLIGFSVDTSETGVTFYEVLRLVISQDGTLSYTAYPAGQTPTTFLAAEATDGKVTFSNPDHDYPQEIAYRREGTVLYATISALNGQNPQSFVKKRCE